MQNSDLIDTVRLAIVPNRFGMPISTSADGNGVLESSAERIVSICVACCSNGTIPQSLPTIIKAVSSAASVRAVILSETVIQPDDRAEIMTVPHGTKLSKIRHLFDSIETDLVCIFDPDLTVDEEACRTVVQVAIENLRKGEDVLAFGIVEATDLSTLLSKVVAIDKWCSHRIIRRCLWAGGIGITVPGQFLVLSPSLLRNLDPGIDSYLDDLVIGWLAWQRGVRVQRVAVVVGQEHPRSCWTSLLTQRIRWMRGIASLFSCLYHQPAAIGLLVAHWSAYHGFPIVALAVVVSLTAINSFAGICAFVILAAIISLCSGRSFRAAAAFLAVFPLIHLFATALWWIPLSRTTLTRR